MSSPKTNTEPMLFGLPTQLRNGGDTLVDVASPAATEPEAKTAPGVPPADAAAESDALGASAGPEVEDILRHMKPARVWSPKPVVNAESQGAAFVAYHAVHDAAKKHLTPPPHDRVVIALPPSTGSEPAAASEPGTALDLGTAIARAQERERASGDANRAAAQGNTTAVVRPMENEGRRRRFLVFALATLAVIVLGAFGSWAAGWTRDSGPETAMPSPIPRGGATARPPAPAMAAPAPSTATEPTPVTSAAPRPVLEPATAASSAGMSARATPPRAQAPGAAARAASPDAAHSASPVVRPTPSSTPEPRPLHPIPPTPTTAPDHVRGI